MKFKNQKVLVTGGTRGIGLGIATAFVKEGADVIIIGVNKERGENAVKQLQGVAVDGEQQIQFVALDVSDADKCEEVLSTLGDIDVLVNNAGVTADGLFMKMGKENWDRVIDVNLGSVFNMTKPLVRGMMKNRRGRIINISSVVGVMGNPGQANYCAAKAGVIGFTRSLAKEVATRGITVNAIAPGFIETDMTSQLNEQQKEAILGQVPMKRLGQPEDIAEAALFLASQGASYITGQVLLVDGGMAS